MKRIIGRNLLALLLVLCALVLTAAAAEGESTGTEPQLTARYYHWEENKPFDNAVLSSADKDNSLWVESRNTLVFFYGDQMIPKSALVTIGTINLTASADERIPDAYKDYVCELRLNAFETGKIMYVDVGTQKTIAELSVTGTLPPFGLFTEAEYSKDRYIWGGTDVNTLRETVYLLGNEKVTITGVSAELGERLVTPEAPQNGETAWKLRLNKGVSGSGRVNLRVSYTEYDHNSEFWVNFNWTDTTPHLYLRNWDGSAWPQTPDTLSYGSTYCVNLCFGTGDASDPVLKASELSSEKESIVFEQQENGMVFRAEYKDRVAEDAIVYKAPDGTTCRLPFRLELPELGIYRDESCAVSSLVGSQRLTLDQGTKPEFYLHWTCGNGEIERISVSGMDGGMDFTIPDLLDESTYPELFGVTFEVNEEKQYVKFVPMITSSNWYEFCMESTGGWRMYTNFNSNSSLYDPTPLPVVTIQGVDYTFGLGTLDFGGESLMQFRSGSGFGVTENTENPGAFDYDVLLTIFSGGDTSERAEAPAWLYECVKDVSFRLAAVSNLSADGTSTVPEPGKENVTLEKQEDLSLRGRSIPQAHLRADAGKFFCARVELTFTLDLTKYGLGEPTYTVSSGAHYTRSGESHFPVSGDMTADDLNTVLSTTENLLEFLQKTNTEGYQTYRRSAANSFTGSYSIYLDLPAVAYDKPIVLAADHPNSMLLFLRGTVNEAGEPLTKMCGLHLDGSTLFNLVGIEFDPNHAKDPATLLKFNGETCAVLGTSYSESKNENGWVAARPADIGNTYQCSFTDFGYGLVSTGGGYFAPPDNCVFRRCGVGLYYDCKDKLYGLYGSYSGRFNRFVQCDTAILIESLPASGMMFSPYNFRFLDNTFINANAYALDFDVRVSGKFYFYRNAYNDSENDALLKYRPAQVRTSNGAVVITNPCRLPDRTLFIQAGQYTEIISSESDKLVISDVSDLVTVAVVGDNEELLGTWTLHPKKEQTAENAVQPLALYADSSEAKGLNPGIQIGESQSGDILVTVAGGDGFEALQPTLTVACPFSACYVTLDGVFVSSTLQGGKVTFPVRAGGVYTVHKGSALSATCTGGKLSVMLGAACEDDTALLFAAEYDETGRLLAVRSQSVKNEDSNYVFTLQGSGTKVVKCFLLSAKTYTPLAEPLSVQ